MQILKALSNKKFRYLFYSLIMMLLFLWVDNSIQESSGAIYPVLIVFLVCMMGAFLTQYPSIADYKGLLVLVPPLALTLGTYFTLYHFPNFSPLFKTMGLLVMGTLFYLISLVNNIYLVVEEKEGLIPLYRVAVTWSQISLIVISIPLFTGAYKLDTNPLIQVGLAGAFTFFFSLYYFWNLSLDKRTRRMPWIDALLNCFFSSFLIVSTGIAVSFVPTEAFLRAIFSASVLLFSLNYLDGYMKNRITFKLIYQHGIIFLISLFILLSFKP